jgi:hypothetical protein
MTQIYDLQQRADVLRKKTATDSISPEEVGGLHADTLAYIANMERAASSLGIKKVYTSVSEMNSDESPVSSTGVPLKYGQLVTIFNAETPDAENSGEIYAFQNPGWILVGRLDAGTADTPDMLKKLIEGDKVTVTNNIRNAFTYLGNFETWAEAQTELDKLHSVGQDNTKIGNFRFLLNGRNIDVNNWVQAWATGIFTQTVQGSIQWNDETHIMDQSLTINTYERQYNGTGWTAWTKNVEDISIATEETSGLLSNNDKKKLNSLPQALTFLQCDEIVNGEGVYFTNATYNFNNETSKYELQEDSDESKLLIPMAGTIVQGTAVPGIMSVESFKQLDSMPDKVISEVEINETENYLEIEISGVELNGDGASPNEYTPIGKTYKIGGTTGNTIGLLNVEDKRKLDVLRPLKYVNHGTSADTSIAINAFEYHRWGEISQILVTVPNEPLTLWGDGEYVVNVYMAEFTSGATATKIGFPTYIKTTPYTIEANKVYRVTIINNLANIESFG